MVNYYNDAPAPAPAPAAAPAADDDDDYDDGGRERGRRRGRRRGAQDVSLTDVSLTGNPQITFFNTVFRRHTAFAQETIEQTIDGSLKPGARLSVKISRDGDLLSNLMIKTDGPHI